MTQDSLKIIFHTHTVHESWTLSSIEAILETSMVLHNIQQELHGIGPEAMHTPEGSVHGAAESQ